MRDLRVMKCGFSVFSSIFIQENGENYEELRMAFNKGKYGYSTCEEGRKLLA